MAAAEHHNHHVGSTDMNISSSPSSTDTVLLSEPPIPPALGDMTVLPPPPPPPPPPSPYSPPPPSPPPDSPPDPPPKLSHRSRWATRKVSVKSKPKRLSAIMRRNANAVGDEKHDATDPRPKDGSNSNNGRAAGGGGDGDDGADPQSRMLFFNLPLPDDYKDDEGNPKYKLERNKIRTAKYKPISFVPKNLWFQFHNVANTFFLFLIILGFFSAFGVKNPALTVIPLIVILILTAGKDAVEDYRRTVLDNELNDRPVHRLCDWDNVNVQEDNVSSWRKFKKANSRLFGYVWRWLHSLWSQAAKEDWIARKAVKNQPEESLPRYSVESTRRPHQAAPSMLSPISRDSFVSAREEIQMTPVPSPLPPDERRRQAIMNMKQDVINHEAPVRGALFSKSQWKALAVGDFVRIYNNDEIPADIVILSTSEADGACYVETKSLDGETNLKVRYSLRCGRELRGARDCERAQFVIESELPQPNLYKYSGAIKWKQTVYVDGVEDEEPHEDTAGINIDNLLLRGCNLRNTEWALGVVLYTGRDTKIMRNSGETPSKRSRIAREMNFNVICNFGFLIVMCLISAIVNGTYWARTDTSAFYFDGGPIGGTPGLTGFVTFWAAFILFQNLIPISLYVTLEIVRTLQALLIFSDLEMWDETLQQPCVPKSWNISDDLGQIEYVFSDKTGTLTQNVMEFKKATVNGVSYGEAYTEAQAGEDQRLGNQVDAAAILRDIAYARVKSLRGLRTLYNNPYLHDGDLTFISPDFVADLAGQGEKGEEQQACAREFALALALCHGVISEEVPGESPKMVFKAQSPDEAALVATARDMGYTVLGTKDGIRSVNILGKPTSYQLLESIEFNSSRKRMSTIVRTPEGKIMLYCKGADSTIYSRLERNAQQDMRRATAEHLEMFAREGLRTLCIAKRELSEAEYTIFRRANDIAAAAIENRDEKLEEVADGIERELRLIGGTAIEDRLQEGVPETISLLADAGIKLWVLTGDKVETAINIGFSCNLLGNQMELITLKVQESEEDGGSEQEYLDKLGAEIEQNLQTFGLTGSDEDLKRAMKDHTPPPVTHALVIDGFALKWALHEQLQQRFLLLCKRCKSVLCCRVSPAQKAAVVKMVKNGLDVMTLSIGDGANDVAMIQVADVGVGIAGLEGRQAAMSSDYAIGQFRFLRRLLLVHGRWSYRRIAEAIPNFFYKNMVWTFAIFWYQTYCQFDMTYIFDYTYILMFNLLFTSLPVGVLGVLDQDVSDRISLAHPQLYRRGIERKDWTNAKFWWYMFEGIVQSVPAWFIPSLVFMSGGISRDARVLNDLTRIGAYVAHPAIITMNMYILLNTHRWDWLMLSIVAFSDLFVFFWTGVWTSFTTATVFYGGASEIYRQPTFWLTFFLTPCVCLLPTMVIMAAKRLYLHKDIDRIRARAKTGEFAHLEAGDGAAASRPNSHGSGSRPSSSNSSELRRVKHAQQASVDEDNRPIYPPSVATHATTGLKLHSQAGSDSTTFTTGPRDASIEYPPHDAHIFVREPSHQPLQHYTSHPQPPTQSRPSLDRARPSLDRVRRSLDPIRTSFEISHDFTSAARLSRIESSQSVPRWQDR